MAELYSNSIFWIEVDKIHPNPFQPRREFDEARLRDLADSIRQYGVLQPLTVSRVEKEKEDGGIAVEYELIAGERRLRASKLAGVREVPCVIRVGDDSMAKLELAIIENLQREDLNPVDRARAFMRLAEEFDFTHAQIANKVGKSREYVSNSLRLLSLPEDILQALMEGKLSEGHTRPLLMLVDKKDEQAVLFKEIVYKKVSVREAEQYARKIAADRIRKKEYAPDPEILELENKFQESLGTRVKIERRDIGGHIKIDFFSPEDLRAIFELLKSNQIKKPTDMLERHIASVEVIVPSESVPASVAVSVAPEDLPIMAEIEEVAILDDRSKEEKKESEEDLYNIKNFSL